MGKNDFLTPKAIANRIKAKGLQKLRWYCQMCQKQCRDENGFKCHTMSESHQRQMQVFGMNPERFVEGYSEEFLEDFMDLMRQSHRFSRVAATVVYNEFINERHHVHMNSTKWLTLTDFVKFLGREGLCKVEDTPKGWFITYIDREYETMFKEKQKEKRERAELAEQDRHDRAIQEQIERAAKQARRDDSDAQVQQDQRALQRDPENGEKIAFAFGGGAATKEKASGDRKKASGVAGAAAAVFGMGEADKDEEQQESSHAASSRADGDRRPGHGKGALDALMAEQERSKERQNRKDYWLAEGIVVKVMSKALKAKGYYKEKGVVRRVLDKYVGEVEMLHDGAVVRVDQEELETVLPKLGSLVRIVNGAYRGSTARLLSVDVDKFCAKVEIEKGPYDGRILNAVEYEDICKVHSD